MTTGQKLVIAIKNHVITKDLPPQTTGRDFKGGYEELYLYKFKRYQSSVCKYLMDKKIREMGKKVRNHEEVKYI